MTRLKVRLRLSGRPVEEAGMALIIVTLVMLVITLLSVGLVTQSIGQLPLARGVQDHQAAVQAAQSGVEDYLSSLNTQPNFWTTATNNVSANGPANTGASGPCPSAPAAQTNCPGWVALPGPTGTESFNYSADTSTTARNGIITITANGCATARVVAGACSGATQTVRESVRRAGFLDDVYFTDYEIVDPNLLGNTSCGSPPNHQWQGGGPDSSCAVIRFASADTLNGPVHSNDAFHMCGTPTFNGPVDSYYDSNSGPGFATAGSYLTPYCTAAPNFQRSGDPAAGLDLPMPTVNSLSAQANPTLTPPGNFGCLFSGTTTLAFRYTSTGVGYVDYTSPNTDFRTLVQNPTSTWNGALCGYPVSPATSGTIPAAALAAGMVIYVQNVPSTNPNFDTCSGSSSCPGDVSIGNTVAALLPVGQLGGLAGQLSIGSDNNIIVTNNVTYHVFPTGNDLLGLIATNYVMVSHRQVVTCDGNGNGNGNGGNCVTTYPGVGETPGTGITIDASILALNHSFYVENWNQGNPIGTLTVNGGIAQVFRGPVATGGGGGISTGYAKAYVYDVRMAYQSPPYFASPAVVSWHKTGYSVLNTCAMPASTC